MNEKTVILISLDTDLHLLTDRNINDFLINSFTETVTESGMKKIF